jgi:hypothetical protein
MRDIEEERDQRELRELREYDAGVPPLDAAARTRVRARLLAAMEAADAPAPAVRPRRPVLRIALAGTVAAAVVGGVVIAGHDGGHRQTAAPPAATSPLMQNVSAETVLHGAAVYARQHEKTPRPRDDQFLYTKIITQETDLETGATKNYTSESWESVDGSKPSWVEELDKGWWSQPLPPGQTSWPPKDWASLRKLPTDPEMLLRRLAPRTDKDAPFSDFTTLQWSMIHGDLIALLEAVPAAPEGLRPAAFEALGMIPGVTVVPGQKDAKGRPGVAIAFDDAWLPKGAVSANDFLIFDPETYAYLGARYISGGGEYGDRISNTSYLDSWAVVDKAKQRP